MPALPWATIDAEFNWNRLPSLSGVEAMSGNDVLKLMANLLAGVRDLGVSDLRISPGSKPCVIHDREMRFFGDCILTAAAAAKLNTILLTPQLRGRFDESQEVNYAMSLSDDKRIRVNLMQQHHGIIGTYHFVPTSILSLQELGFIHEKVIDRLLDYQHGLILVSGRSGHGKTSTLAAMVDYINENYGRFILSLESPIEFIYTNRRSIIAQREIGTHCETLEEALRNAMRSSPDVILISDELEDPACIKLALTCASMGTLVLCSAHTSNAGKALERLITMFPVDERVQIELMLAKTLVGVVAQILCDRADGQGKVPAHEIVMRCETLSNIVRQGEILNLRNYINDEIEGMQSFDACLRQMLAENRVSPPEAYMHAANKTEFAEYLPERTYFGADGSAASAVAEEEDNRPT